MFFQKVRKCSKNDGDLPSYVVCASLKRFLLAKSGKPQHQNKESAGYNPWKKAKIHVFILI